MPSAHESELPTLGVNADRLAASLHESCQYGSDHRYGKLSTETGMARLSLDDSDKAVRDWFLQKAKSLRCTTSIDEMGNLFAVRRGKNADAPPIMMGSHLDTQPTGGRYDGILGVLAGLEVLQVLEENKIETEGSVGVVNWTNEEGARFPKMAVSSGVWAGAVPIADAWNLEEVTPHEGTAKTMLQELERIGYRGEAPASYTSNPFAAHFELHIEQGPILEDEGRKIGVVQGVQAFKWFNITVRGRDSHAGTTPLYARKDAVLVAAKMIVAANAVAKAHSGLATTGIFTAAPGTVNTMAHTATFTLDLRHTSDAVLATMLAECRAAFQAVAAETEKGCDVDWTLLVDSPAVVFHQDCIDAVQASAEAVCARLPGAETKTLWKPMISGAGHDSCYTNLRCPTSMIFTPTREGISHNPTEYCSAEDCALGASVLLGAVLGYDKLRADRGDFENTSECA
ncbi:hydantoin utilization protein C, putative [Cordyceps militaris CM01]|uniref:Hydantoin utilization protein C, putative n=1 Tax=Cordyceps militaris (strain CM01) TaxID=983644 RepID=G3JLA1_CORMM|nr:hydantoin utilization protein C, putative [Cordyceps militaris CM01]EGX90475.1 hydantoin utilization protein C, putative [Cordyceps militaris CM01]